MSQINGPLRHTFSGTGRSPSRFSVQGRTLALTGTDAFTVIAQASYDEGVSWTDIESFTASTVQNFEWLGKSALVSYNCTAFTSNPVELIFE
jgi:hypothetical protein